MAAKQPTIGGRKVPVWTGAGLRLLFTLILIGIAAEVSDLLDGAAEPLPPSGAAVAAAPVRAGTTSAAPGAFRRLTIGRQMLHGEYVWDETGAAPGPIRILVDLDAQTLSVIRSGREIGRAVILYGTDDQPTPTGTFPILEKDRDHVSNLYEAIMPFMLRLTHDGIAIHGSNVRYGWASRGCVGVPDEFAAMIFERVRVGDRVTIVGRRAGAAAPSA